MRFKKKYWFGIVIAFIVLLIGIFFFRDTNFFVPVVVISISIAWGQAWLDFFSENKRQHDIETRFLDFVRNLTGAIKSGMPVSRAIMHVAKINYGALTPYVQKLGYQVEWSIPVHRALLFFSNSSRSDIIKRSIATVIEAEQSGGNIEDVLESITTSLIEIKKIKEERRASIHSQTVQSYIIFFIFIGVILVLQNMFVPYVMGDENLFSINSGNSAIPGLTSGSSSSSLVTSVNIKFDNLRNFIITLSMWFVSLRGIFVMQTMIQGFFAGVIIGKMSEGDIVSGLKHSLILMTISFFIMSLFPMG